jgi:hypothetical protein
MLAVLSHSSAACAAQLCHTSVVYQEIACALSLPSSRPGKPSRVPEKTLSNHVATLHCLTVFGLWCQLSGWVGLALISATHDELQRLPSVHVPKQVEPVVFVIRLRVLVVITHNARAWPSGCGIVCCVVVGQVQQPESTVDAVTAL